MTIIISEESNFFSALKEFLLQWKATSQTRKANRVMRNANYEAMLEESRNQIAENKTVIFSNEDFFSKSTEELNSIAEMQYLQRKAISQ